MPLPVKQRQKLCIIRLTTPRKIWAWPHGKMLPMVVFSNLIHRLQKNYSDEKQIRQSERAVTGYFDYIEDLIERENVFTMEEFSKSVNEFLAFRRYDILKDNGRISHKQAMEKAYQEYDIFNKTQPIESDFDKVVKGLAKAGK